MIRRRGVADQTIFFVARDASNDPFALAYNTAGISVKYYRPGAASATAITPATQTANGAHADGGLIAIEEGLIRLDLPDAACAAGVNEVFILVKATGMKTLWIAVELTDADPTLAPSTPAEVAEAVADVAIEGATTLRESVQIANAALGGKSSNGGKTYRDLADTKNRLVATVDASKNRTAMTRNTDP